MLVQRKYDNNYSIFKNKINYKQAILWMAIFTLVFLILNVLIKLGFPFLGDGNVYRINEQGMKCFCNSIVINKVCLGPQTCAFIDPLLPTLTK